jgi:hypothetical protein
MVFQCIRVFIAVCCALAGPLALAAEPASVPAPAVAASMRSAVPLVVAATAPPAVPAPATPPTQAAAVPPGVAPVPAGPVQAAGLDSRIQDLKGEVIRLNRDLLVLEEELLFPAGTQVAVFLSMDVGKLFALDSVQIKLDDKVVANYLYTPREVEALHRGGVQRLYLGNLRAGEHSLVAFFTGKGPHERDYKRGATLKIDKGTDPKYIELQIKDSMGKLQPEFEVKVWQ